MNTLTPPQARIPFGYVQIGAQRLEVQPHPEWMRYFAQALMQRVGGTVAPTITDLDGDLTSLSSEVAALPVSAPIVADDLQEPAAAPLVLPDDQDVELFALRAEVAALRIEIEALKQGITA